MANPITMSEALSVMDIADASRYLMLFGDIPIVGDGRDLSLRCTQAVMAGTSNEAYDVNMPGGHQLNFRGRRLYANTLSLTFAESMDARASEILRAWKEYVAGAESGNSGGYIDDYSITAELQVFDTVGAAYETMTFYRLYLQDIPEVSHSADSSTPVVKTATFRFTRFISSLVEPS